MTTSNVTPPPPNVFTMYKIGIGPSSSHTMGPMVAAKEFRQLLAQSSPMPDHIIVTLHGSLAATGEGHGTLRAVVAGLNNLHPAKADNASIKASCDQTSKKRTLSIDNHSIAFCPKEDIHLEFTPLPLHPNGMTFEAFTNGQLSLTRNYYSTGGGAITDDTGKSIGSDNVTPLKVPYPYKSADNLIDLCKQHNLSIAELSRQNESSWQTPDELSKGIAQIWSVMRACIDSGLKTEGILPGGLDIQRRAPNLSRSFKFNEEQNSNGILNSISNQRALTYAMAVNEENAAGGRVVTAPTNGAAGIVPAVLATMVDHRLGGDDVAKNIETFILTSSAIGGLFKMNASISGAEMGCQGEVGTATAMAAAGLAAVAGANPKQIENAAEIAIEHSLGLTCDPIAGLVQAPCIERNGIGAGKAIMAAQLAMTDDGSKSLVSLDQAIEAMRKTGLDMHDKYKETARGGLAAEFAAGLSAKANGSDPAENPFRIPVATVEC